MTDDTRKLIESLAVAMLGTEDGDLIENESEIPAGEMFRLAADWVRANASAFRRSPVPPETDEAIGELVDAIRLTVEYIGNGWLPPIKGWSWFDALVKYAPEVADEFKRNPIHPVASVPPVTEETVTAVEELDALPRGVVVRADDGLIFERAGWARVYPWRTPNSTHDFSAEQIALPARVLYRPIPEGDKPDA